MSASFAVDRQRHDFLAGGGEMGRLIRAYDWAANELGDPASWPQSLRTVVRLMLNTRHPIFVFWGPNSICLYNDAYSASLGPENIPSVWASLVTSSGPKSGPPSDPRIAQVMAGGAAAMGSKTNLIPITRFGHLE